VSHAQILVGEAESVRALAHTLAKGINCLDSKGPDNNEPCGRCLSCRVFETGNHPDTFYVTKTKQNSIGVDDIREQIIEPMSTKPYSYNYKVFIIDKAETLTPAAQSALLKTIEEPAPYGFFLFLAPQVHSFLPTVLSRCYVRKIYGNAVLSTELQDAAREIVESADNSDIVGAFALYQKLEKYKESKETLQQLLDCMYHVYGGKIAIASKENQFPQEKWLTAVSAISHTKNVLSKNGNTQLAIELMLVKLSGKGQEQ
jgi:DNA polymerase III delta prime subunit